MGDLATRIHPSTNTFANSSQKKKIQKKNQICFPSCSYWPKKTNEKKHTHDKKLRKTKQQMITDTNKDVYTGTFLDSKAPSIRNVMGLFPDESINLVPKASCDDPKPSLSFCLPIVATCGGRGSPFKFGCHTLSQHCGCALPLRLSICCQRLRKENQSHQHDSKKN